MNTLSKDILPADQNKMPPVIMFSITVVSMGLLAFEICLTRLLSVMLSYHYVYGVTSLALLGTGIGAIVIHYAGRKQADIDFTQLYNKLVLWSGFVSISMIVSVLVVIQISKVNVGHILVFGLLLCSPFFFGGMFLSTLFKIFSTVSGKLYSADLTGAALGCGLVVLSMNALGDIESILLFSSLISITSTVIAIISKSDKKLLSVSSSGIVLLILLLLISSGKNTLFQIPIGTNAEKEIYDSLHAFDGEIIETRHSAFGRTDLIQYGDIPEHMDLYLDGTAGTPMYKFNGDIYKPNKEVKELKTFPGFFPVSHFTSEEKDSALIIGPGGGRDVLIALLGGIDTISAVEVNPDLVDLVKDYSWYNGGIYSSMENIQLIVDEGRSYLRSNTANKYDLIMLTLPRTNTSRSVEGYALTENYLFTTNSIKEYLDRINKDGHLVVVANDDSEILRLMSLTLTVFEQQGIKVSDAMESVYILGSTPNPVFVLKNGHFDDKIIHSIYEDAIYHKGYNASTSFFPNLSETNSIMNPIFLGLANGQLDLPTLIAMVKDLGYDIQPVSDNDPFFYKLMTGLPESIVTVLTFSSILIVALITALLALDREKTRNSKTQGQIVHITRNKAKYVAIFCMLGIGYMVIEISFIQKFVFFLGKPVLSLTVILFSVLLGSGIGGYLSSIIEGKSAIRIISRATIALVILLLSYNYFLIPTLFNYLLGIEFVYRLTISVVIILPLSILMGMPFPLMIREMHQVTVDYLIPWMWGINAVSSVFGSVIAMVLAISLGYNQAVVVAALCYLFTNIILRFLKQTD